MIKILLKKFTTVTFFSIAMGFLEAAVVVYLREIIYPEGFCFPLKEIPLNIFFVELGRETSTIIMLVTIAIISGKTLLEKFCYFIYCFGIWDIFYYIWLKVTLNWPPSLLTDDILFLIPVPWTGPVLAPVIVSLTMIIIAVTIIFLLENGYSFVVERSVWVLSISGAMIIFISFIWNFPNMTRQQTLPEYHYELLLAGEFLGLSAFIRLLRRRKKYA